MCDTIYFVLCYVPNSDHYIWIGGQQNDRMADARYWQTEEEAEAVVEKNRKTWRDFINNMEAMDSDSNHVYEMKYKVIPMSRKVYMKQCLIEE